MVQKCTTCFIGPSACTRASVIGFASHLSKSQQILRYMYVQAFEQLESTVSLSKLAKKWLCMTLYLHVLKCTPQNKQVKVIKKINTQADVQLVLAGYVLQRALVFLVINSSIQLVATYILSMSSLSLSALGRSTLLPSTRTWARENKTVNRRATCLHNNPDILIQKQEPDHKGAVRNPFHKCPRQTTTQEANVHRTYSTNIHNLHTGLSGHEDQDCQLGQLATAGAHVVHYNNTLLDTFCPSTYPYMYPYSTRLASLILHIFETSK